MERATASTSAATHPPVMTPPIASSFHHQSRPSAPSPANLIPASSASPVSMSPVSESGVSSAEPPRSHMSGSSSSEMKQRVASALTELHEAQRALQDSERLDSQMQSRDPSVAPASELASPTMRDVPEASQTFPSASGPVKTEHIPGPSLPGLTVPAAGLSVVDGFGSTTSSRLLECSDDDVSEEDHSRGVKQEGGSESGTSGTVSLGHPSLDLSSLTPLQRHALEQATEMRRNPKEKGYSCHQCKTSKDGSVLLFCINKAEKGRRKRNCRKKYCDACLRRAYNMSLDNITKDEIENWRCPACLSKCVCAACSRKHDLAMQTQQKMAAIHALMPHYGAEFNVNGNGMTMGINTGSIRSNVGLSMHAHMQLAAAQAAGTPSNPPAAPVPAIVPAVPVTAGTAVTSPFQFAQAATTLASTHDLKPPMHAHPAGLSQLAPLSVSLNLVPPHSQSAHAAHSPKPFISKGSVMPAQVAADGAHPPQQPPHTSPNGSHRPRAFSCPTSPTHAPPVAWSFPPQQLLSQQSQGPAVPPIPSHPKYPSLLQQHPASAHMSTRTLEMQPSHESRTPSDLVQEGMPQRRRRNSLKVTPMGKTHSRNSSRGSSPFLPGNEPLYSMQQHHQFLHGTHSHQSHDSFQLDYSLGASFSQSMHINPPPPHADSSLQHSTPNSPRSRRHSFHVQQAIAFPVPGGAALPAIDLSIQPPDSAQNSAHNSPRHPHNSEVGEMTQEQMMLISPFQQQQPASGMQGSMMLISPQQPAGQSILASPQQQPHPLGFQISPQVSPSQLRHSSFLQHQTGGQTFASPREFGLRGELDLPAAGGSGMDPIHGGTQIESSAATHAMQRLLQQQAEGHFGMDALDSEPAMRHAFDSKHFYSQQPHDPSHSHPDAFRSIPPDGLQPGAHFPGADALAPDLSHFNGDGVSLSGISGSHTHFNPFSESHELACASNSDSFSLADVSSHRLSPFSFSMSSNVLPLLPPGHSPRHGASFLRKYSTPLPFLNTSPATSPSHAQHIAGMQMRQTHNLHSATWHSPSNGLHSSPTLTHSARASAAGAAVGAGDGGAAAGEPTLIMQTALSAANAESSSAVASPIGAEHAHVHATPLTSIR